MTTSMTLALKIRHMLYVDYHTCKNPTVEVAIVLPIPRVAVRAAFVAGWGAKAEVNRCSMGQGCTEILKGPLILSIRAFVDVKPFVVAINSTLAPKSGHHRNEGVNLY